VRVSETLVARWPAAASPCWRRSTPDAS